MVAAVCCIEAPVGVVLGRVVVLVAAVVGVGVGRRRAREVRQRHGVLPGRQHGVGQLPVHGREVDTLLIGPPALAAGLQGGAEAGAADDVVGIGLVVVEGAGLAGLGPDVIRFGR